MADLPILTIKLESVSLDKGAGPDVRIKIQAGSGPAVDRIGASTSNRWLFQDSYALKTIKIHIDVTEVDPVYTESAAIDKSLTLDVPRPRKKGMTVHPLP